MEFMLTKPSLEKLPEYTVALRQGWSPDNLRPTASAEQLEKIGKDPVAFVARLDDPEAKGDPVALPDGSSIPRLPGFQRWLWDGEFCGVIGFRWQHGTPELPPTCLGHIGFAVVPWKRNRGYATKALGLLLLEARAQGLPYVELTANPDNIASQKVILANGGELLERFTTSKAYGGEEHLRFRITL
jgi:predicted acetyltransferase